MSGRVVVFAYHDVGCMGIRTLVDLGIDVARVYTHEDDPAEKRWYGSVAATCRELSVTATTANPHLPDEIAAIRTIAPDAIFSFYYRDMLKDEVLSLAKHGGYNLHGSLLPRYRGRAPVNWQILHGEKEGGVTLHHMVKRADAGDIVGQNEFPIGRDDTPVEVYENMLLVAVPLLRQYARAIVAGGAPRWRQMESKATKFGRRRPEDGLIDWQWCAEDVRNLVRAVTDPYPGAFTFASGVRVIVWSARIAQPSRRLLDRAAGRNVAPGSVLRESGGEVVVACGDSHLLELRDVQVGDRRGVPADFPDVLKGGVVLGGAGA